MNNRIVKYLLTGVACVAGACSLRASAKSDVFDQIEGTWRVRRVMVDSLATRTSSYQLDDPRLKGRLFTFARNEVANDSPEGVRKCISPVYTLEKIRISALIESSMGGRLAGPPKPKPEDFGLRDSGIGVRLIRISCEGKVFEDGLGADGGIPGAWFVLEGNNAGYIRWYDEVILRVEKLPGDYKIAPSFACVDRLNETEKAICDSPSLSSLDQSMDATYKAAMGALKQRRSDEQATKFKQSQDYWITRRNACRGNIECIKTAILQRLDEVLDSSP